VIPAGNTLKIDVSDRQRIKENGSQRSLTISMRRVYDGFVLLGGQNGKKPTEQGRKENWRSDG
jgi:hypothetical protein